MKTSSALPPAAAPSLPRLRAGRELSVLILLVLLAIGVTLVNPRFLALGNVSDILVNAAPTAIVACGLTLVVVMGEIDISVGSLMGLLAAVMGVCSSTERMGLPVAVGIAATLGLGALIGFINGALVVWGRVPSIIVTLGMLTALRGITVIVTGGEWIKGLPDGLRALGTGSVVGLPISVLVATLVVIATAFLARDTPLGRRIYAAGSNPHAARLAGLKVSGLKLFVFTLTGFLVGVATLVSVTQQSVIESGIGNGFELLVVTCVVVGGTSIAGGRGSILGSLFATLLLTMMGTALIFLKLGPSATYWEQAIQGVFILLAVLTDHLTKRDKAVEA